MGFNYLEGRRWADVTREERFFCQRLYEQVRREGAERFAAYVSDRLGMALPREGEWEIGFEVCFYRDLWQHRGREDRLHSPKRTFDLCLFGQRAIVIIEAKAAETFEKNQNARFEEDVAHVRELTGVERVELIGLCSSRYTVGAARAAAFDNRILRWNDLAARYDGDAVLRRADAVYESKRASASPGKNADAKLTGAALLGAFRNGKRYWVGCLGGLTGKRFSQEIRSGKWETRIYDVNTTAPELPSRNFFSLEAFAHAVEQGFPGAD